MAWPADAESGTEVIFRPLRSFESIGKGRARLKVESGSQSGQTASVKQRHETNVLRQRSDKKTVEILRRANLILFAGDANFVSLCKPRI